MRDNATDAERRMWALLRSAFADRRFRKQLPFRQSIADLASHRARIVIEIDGYRVVRFWNNDVLTNIKGIAVRLAEVLAEISPPPNPPPSRGRACRTGTP